MKKPSPVLDKMGVCASAFCAVHCLLTGVALGLLSSLGMGFFDHPVVDALFLIVAAVVGGFALVHGARHHRSFVPALFFVVGLAAFGASHAIEHMSPKLLAARTVLNVAGGMCLVLFHVFNLRLQRARHCCGEGNICLHPDRHEHSDRA